MTREDTPAAALAGATSSLQTRLVLIFAALSLGATALFGWLAYDASRASLRNMAQNATVIAAEDRVDALRRRLGSRVERAAGFQQAHREVCGPDATSPGQETACTEALANFGQIEGFSAAVLFRADAPAFLLGTEAPALASAPRFEPGQIARFDRSAPGGSRYIVEAPAPDGRTLLVMRFDDLEPVNVIFAQSVGLGESGETFLADAGGRFITPPMHAGVSGMDHPIEAEPMRRCLAGQSGVMLAPDYRGAQVIHAFRHVDFIGGGCIMAHMAQAEAFAPARALRIRIGGLGLGLMVLFVVVSILLARSVSRPILRLSASARALERGDLAHPIPAEGPTEVRVLAEALSSMARAIRERTDSLKEANQAKSEFLATMSHELRTPLNAIAGYVDLMEIGVYGQNSPEQLRALERIRRSQHGLLTLINDILQYAKIEAGSLEFRIEDVRVATLLAEMEAVAEHQVRDSTHTYSVESCETALAVRADPDRVQQILLNLLTNAVKFTPPGGHIRVTCEADGERVAIRVHDTGPGIPAEMTNRIFDPFVQVRSSTGDRESHPGVGLGLAISRDLARGMDGDVVVESTPGRGSTFTLSLLRADGRAEEEKLSQ